MTNEIINLFPSQKLKDKIREIGHEFSDRDLISIIYLLTPTLNARNEMLSRFAETASPESAAMARAIIKMHDDNLNAFRKNSPNEIYWVNVRSEKYEGEIDDLSDFFAASYESALKAIDAYCEAEKGSFDPQNENTEYYIKKVKLFTDNKSEDGFFPNDLGECKLDYNKEPLYAYDDSIGYDGMEESGAPTPLEMLDLTVPNIFKDGDIISYPALDRVVRYSVLHGNPSLPLVRDLICVPLDCYGVTCRDFEEVYHDIAGAYEAVPVSPDDLPEDMRENYYTYMKYLDEHPEE